MKKEDGLRVGDVKSGGTEAEAEEKLGGGEGRRHALRGEQPQVEQLRLALRRRDRDAAVVVLSFTSP